MTMTASINNNPAQVNASDYLLMLIPNFTHGRVGTVSVDSKGVHGVSAGLRKSSLVLIQGTAAPTPPPPAPPLAAGEAGHGRGPPPPAPPAVPSISLGVSLATDIALSTDATMTAAAITAKTKAYRAKEAATLDGWGEWFV